MTKYFKVSCEYYIAVDDGEDSLDMARDFVNNEIIDGGFEESHIIIDEVNESYAKANGVYNE